MNLEKFYETSRLELILRQEFGLRAEDDLNTIINLATIEGSNFIQRSNIRQYKIEDVKYSCIIEDYIELDNVKKHFLYTDKLGYFNEVLRVLSNYPDIKIRNINELSPIVENRSIDSDDTGIKVLIHNNLAKIIAIATIGEIALGLTLGFSVFNLGILENLFLSGFSAIALDSLVASLSLKAIRAKDYKYLSKKIKYTKPNKTLLFLKNDEYL